jgi:hypothetical protein
MDPIDRFKPFLLTKAEAVQLRSEFSLLSGNFTLLRSEVKELTSGSYKDGGGIYFLLLKYKSKKYKIYIGKTKRLKKRLMDYANDFQAHSPNDYKLQLFVTYLAMVAPGASLELHFARKEAEHLTEAEKRAIDQFKPLLNQLRKPDPEAKKRLTDAFALYYQSAIEQTLKQ